MRKIYSIVLMACAMLVSASSFAVESVGLLSELQTAINSTSVGGKVDIQLTADIKIEDTDSPICIYGQIVTLDLAGHNIIAHKRRAIEIYQGTLNITGNGTIEKDNRVESKNSKTMKYSYSSQDAIAVFGSIADVAAFSNLTIGEGVKINAHGDRVPADASEDAGDETLNGISVLDNRTLATNKTLYGTDDRKGYAYGVNVHIYGTVYGSKYGIKINGTINQTEGDNIPYVKIYPTAEVYSAPNTSNSIAIYSSGYGKFDIQGYVHGATGVYVKGGKVDLKDAYVKSDFTEGYKVAEGQSSGVDAGGSAVVVESNSSYVGKQEVTIEGDTKVEGGSGYAIDEIVTTSGESKVSQITVEGGSIVAGDKGSTIISEKTANNKTLEIIGATLGAGDFYVRNEDGSTTATNPETFVPTIGYTTTKIYDEEGKLVATVVTEGEAVAGQTSVLTAIGNNLTEINWTPDADAAEELDADVVTLDYLEMTSDKSQVLHIGKNAATTLTIGKAILGTKAQLIVYPGSKLIITDKNGIVSFQTNNIVLKTQESNPAQFLFNPSVITNRHPNATVELIANSYTNPDDSKNDYLYQRFGVPTNTAVKSVTAKNPKTGENVQMFVRKYENNGWTNVGYLNVAGKSFDLSRLNDPFGYYILQCNTAAVGTLVSFAGELVGNINADLTMGQNTNGWSTFANSYTGQLDMSAMLTMFEGLPEETNVAIYFQDFTKSAVGTDMMNAWDVLNKTTEYFFKKNPSKTKLNPMQTFLLKDPDASATGKLALNYQSMVYDPATNTSSPAPRRVAADMTMASIRLTNNNDAVYMIQGDEFSSEIESGYDSEKYMSGNANIYVMNDKKYATCATNDLENTYIGFSCTAAGNYTLSFENIAGENLALVDMVDNKVIDMTEGAEYEFYAQESNDYRFKVVGRNNVATDVETIENAVKAAGVYTLTGMYLGNMSVWNTLPAGVYVVNGEKRVK